jgi:hypothetical protein
MMVKRNLIRDARGLEIGGDPWMTHFTRPSHS